MLCEWREGAAAHACMHTSPGASCCLLCLTPVSTSIPLWPFPPTLPGFYRATGRLLTECPLPSEYSQHYETKELTPVPQDDTPTTDPQLSRLFEPGQHERLGGEEVPGRFNATFEENVLLPIRLWLQAQDDAQVGGWV